MRSGQNNRYKKIIFRLLIFTVLLNIFSSASALSAASGNKAKTAVIPAPSTTSVPVINSADIPKSDFLKKMFEDAIYITDAATRETVSDEKDSIKEIKKVKVEPPPAGRSKTLQSKIVPLSINGEIPEPVGYFKNIVFLGDSVTLGFGLFKSKITFDGANVLKYVKVVSSGGYGVYNASLAISDTSVHPLYNGKQVLPEDIIAEKDAKYVFTCLGLNDVALLSVEKYITLYGDLIDRIKKKNPDKIIVIMSVTPIIDDVKKTLSNEKIMKANNALIVYAGKNNIPFIDYAAAIRDSDNTLYKDLASDGFCHLTIEAYNRLVEYMLYHPVIQ